MSNDDAPVFSLRATRDEDLRVAAAEYEEWLNEKLSLDPTPTLPMQTSIKVTVSRVVQIDGKTIAHVASAEVSPPEIPETVYDGHEADSVVFLTDEYRAAVMATALFATLPSGPRAERDLSKTLV